MTARAHCRLWIDDECLGPPADYKAEGCAPCLSKTLIVQCCETRVWNGDIVRPGDELYPDDASDIEPPDSLYRWSPDKRDGDYRKIQESIYGRPVHLAGGCAEGT